MAENLDINKLLDEARWIITNPAGYYQSMEKSGGFTNPVIYVAVMGVATGVITAVLSMFSARVGLMAAGVGALIIIPLGTVIGSFISAAILFIIWKLMGSNHNYQVAYRCLAPATAIYPLVAVISLVPYLGTAVGIIWGTLLMIIASVIVHGLRQKTAATVFGILAVLMLISNLASEHASRKMVHWAEEKQKILEDYNKLPPEEMGRKMGEFIKGIQDGMDDNRKPPQ